jgi:GNAT superfamily N-acetyltransferase
MAKIQYDSFDVLDVYAQHLKALPDNDKFTRFGYKISDASIDSFILKVLYSKKSNHLFTAKANDVIVGFGHLAQDHDGWELAVSVSKDFQNQGIASKLIEFMIGWAKVHGITSLFMHCIHDNKKIQHLSTKHGLKVILRDGQDLTAKMELPPPDALDYTAQYFRDQRELLTQIVELQKQLVEHMSPIGILKKYDHID